MKKVKIFFMMVFVIILCCGCVGFNSDEPCEYCYAKPTKEYITTSGTKCYICESHATTCFLCGYSSDMELIHYTNLLDIETFVCRDCYEKYHQ